MKKRVLSFLLAALMIFSLFSVTVWADEGVEPPTGYTTDENGHMAYKPDASEGYDFKGYVDGWRQVTFGYYGFKAAVYGGNGLDTTATPKFVADGQAIQMTYTVTNNTDAAVNDFRFYIAADTMIAGNDESTNEVDEDNVVIMTNGGVSLFALSTTEAGAAVATEYSMADVSYRAVTAGADPSTVTSVASAGDSAFVMYFPLTTLGPGESAEYNFVIGMGSSETIQDIIEQVRAALGLVDYKNEKITGLGKSTTFIFEYGEGQNKQTYTITSNEDGEIPLSGKDNDGNDYSFIGQNIKYYVDGSPDDAQELTVAGRPQTPSGESILPTDESYAKPEDVLVDTVTEDSVKILPVEGQEYQYSTDSGATWTAVPSGGEITGLTSGSTIQIRTRIAATNTAPASEYSDVVSIMLKQSVNTLDGFSTVGYNGIQNGQPHSITVTVPDGVTVAYSEAVDAAYTATNPAYTEPGEYTVYYRVTKEGCYPSYGSEKVIIKSAMNMLAKALKGETVVGAEDLFTITDDVENVRTIQLKVDFTADELSEILTVGTAKEIILDLNGHVINANGKTGSVIKVPKDATLNLIDNAPTTEHAGYVDADGLWHLGAGEGTAKNIKGGIITGGTGSAPSGYSTHHGGGVLVDGGSFTMSGGAICGNVCEGYGGGVYLTELNTARNIFTMTGGEIFGNVAGKEGTSSYGGGVFASKYSTVTLGGTAVVRGNHTKGDSAVAESNIHLQDSKKTILKVSTNTPLTEGADIGVTIYASSNWAPGTEAGSYLDNTMTDDNYKYFVMNNSGNANQGTLYPLTKDGSNYVLAGSFSVTVDSSEHGEVQTDKETYISGETVTVTVTPSDGYQLTANSLKATYTDGNAQTQTITPQATQTAGEYTFQMPAYAVTVKAEFEEIPHSHTFTYTTNYGTITATCTEGCEKDYDTTPLTLTLSAPESLVYDGNAKAFTFADGEATAWTGAGLELPAITYEAKTGSSLTDGSAINAGSYTAKASVTVGGQTYTATKDFEISKATLPTELAVSLTGWTYGETDNNPSVTGNVGNGAETYTYKVKDTDDSTYTGTKPVNAGSYTVRASIAETTNYEAATVGTDFTIAKATPYIKAAPAPSDITYGQTLADSTLFNGYAQVSSTNTTQVSGQFEWKDGTTKPAVSDSETTEYEVIFTPFDTTNYNTTTCKVKVTVKKASQEAPAANTGYTIDYAEETLTASDATHEVSTSDTELVSLVDNKVVPGSTCYVRVKGDDDHEPSAWTPITVPERPAAVTGVTAQQETVMKKDDACLRGVTQEMEYRFKVDGGEYGSWIGGYGTSIGFVFDVTQNPINRYDVEVRTKAMEISFAGEATTFTFTPNTTDMLTVTMGETNAKVAYGALVTKPALDPEKSGYTFGGWYLDKACTQAWNFGTDTVTEDMELYPKWIENAVQKASISGNVTEGGSGVAGATVELYLGTVKVAATVTDTNGDYNFDNVENGIYNIVVTKGDKVKTELVTVNSTGSFSVNVALPDSAVNSVVKVEDAQIDDAKSDVSKTVVGGLDNIAEAETPALGETITIRLTVEPKEESEVENADEIKREAGNGKKIEFLDMSLWKQVNDEAAQPIGGTNTQLLTIVIPFDFINVDVSSVMILRKHGSGNAEKLTKNPDSSQEGFTVDEQAGTITIYAMKFSDYALAYEEKSSSGGGGVCSYAVETPSNIKNGKVEVSPKNASAGQTVTLTVTPDKGFTLETLTVTDKNGKEVEVKSLGNNKYSFKMPSGKVTVSATFTQIVDSTVCPQDETCVYAKFTDADTKAWYHDGVHFCVENGYMQGVSTTAFDPSGTTTRAMIVTMLWRMEGEPVANYAMSFKDVKADQWYTEAIRWAQSTGVVEGYSAEAFGPGKPITREQMATILYRYAKYHSIDVTNTNTLAGYTDVNKISAWALDAMKWANAVGLVQGRTTTTLVPELSITRAEAATMVHRYCIAFQK